MIRLDKYLADMGVGTRVEVKKYIRQGKVKIDGVEVQLTENNTFTLTNVVASHAIVAYFTPDLTNGTDFFKITLSSGTVGTVSPNSEKLVKPVYKKP